MRRRRVQGRSRSSPTNRAAPPYVAPTPASWPAPPDLASRVSCACACASCGVRDGRHAGGGGGCDQVCEDLAQEVLPGDGSVPGRPQAQHAPPLPSVRRPALSPAHHHHPAVVCPSLRLANVCFSTPGAPLSLARARAWLSVQRVLGVPHGHRLATASVVEKTPTGRPCSSVTYTWYHAHTHDARGPCQRYGESEEKLRGG